MREDWVEVKLGHILEIERGGSPRPIKEYLTNDENGINWVKIGDTKNSNKYITKTFQKIKPSGLHKTRIVNPGDFVLSNSMSFGKPYIMGIKGAIHDGWLVLRDQFEVLDKDFLYYALSSPFVFNQFSKLAKGSTVKNLNVALVSEVKINLIPLPEQRAIVAKIEQLFSSLDQGIADLSKAREQLKVYRQAVLKKAFEGELTREWREKQTNLPTAEELLEQIKAERQKHYQQQLEDWKNAVKKWEENGKKYRRPVRPVKLTEIKEEQLKNLHDINWLMVEMGVLAELIDPQPSHRTPPKVENGIPFISTANFNKETGEIDFKNARKVSEEVLKDHISLYELIDGDFVVGKIGTVGKPFFIPSKRFFALSANLVLIQTRRKVCDSKYLFFLIKSNFIQDQFSKGTNSTTQGAFGIKKFRLLKIPTPSIAEQTQIVKEIESRLSVCDQVEQIISESLAKADALRQSILKKAFEGKLLSKAELEACRQEADWEPAQKLLERIREEKKHQNKKKK